MNFKHQEYNRVEDSQLEFGWAVCLPTVSVKITVAIKLDTVIIL